LVCVTRLWGSQGKEWSKDGVCCKCKQLHARRAAC
jgi:hypothetical protein